MVDAKKAAHTTPAASIQRNLFGEGCSTDVAVDDDPNANQGHFGNVPRSGCFFHEFLPPSVSLPPCTTHGSFQPGETFLPECKLDDVAMFKSEGNVETNEQIEKELEALHASCSKCDSGPEPTAMILTVKTGTPHSESCCPSKQMHSTHKWLQGSDSEHDFSKEEHGVPPIEIINDNEHSYDTLSSEKECVNNISGVQVSSRLPDDILVDNVGVGELPANESLPDKLPINVQVSFADNGPASNASWRMRTPKEELIETFEEARQKNSEMDSKEKISDSHLTETSSEEIPPRTPHQRRSTIYRLRKFSVGKHEVEEEETNTEDGCQERFSKGTSSYSFTFNSRNCHRGSVTIEAVVKYPADYEAPHSSTGKIVKALEGGLLYGTPDAEARKAVKDAQRRLTKYNLKQACKSGGLQNAQNLSAGLCVVEFFSKGSYQRTSLQVWTYDLAHIVGKYFATDYCAQKFKLPVTPTLSRAPWDSCPLTLKDLGH
ncbi:hypothetical protein L7F22_068441 [Adiantum nelumboides]|nr:hypothetical protein [Adiantum nelumboides]